jgi:hypothetical protein
MKIEDKNMHVTILVRDQREFAWDNPLINLIEVYLTNRIGYVTIILEIIF